MAEVHALPAHWDALASEQIELSATHRDTAVGTNHSVPGNRHISRRKHVTHEAGCARIDVAVGAHEALWDRANSREDRRDSLR